MPVTRNALPAAKKEQVIACLQKGGGILQAAEKVGVCRTTIYAHMKRDEAFAKEIDAARDRSDENVVNALYEAAIAGNTTAMIFWLKNRQPNQWRDRHDFKVEHNTDGIHRAEFAEGSTVYPTAAAELPN